MRRDLCLAMLLLPVLLVTTNTASLSLGHRLGLLQTSVKVLLSRTPSDTVYQGRVTSFADGLRLFADRVFLVLTPSRESVHAPTITGVACARGFAGCTVRSSVWTMLKLQDCSALDTLLVEFLKTFLLGLG